jgi:hypothetical protein
VDYDRLLDIEVNDATSAFLNILARYRRNYFTRVSADDINMMRDYMEVYPVSATDASGNVYITDATEKTDIRFSNALSYWNLLGVSEIPWTMADNNVYMLSEADLQAIYDSMRQNRALRALSLHQYATTLKNDTTLMEVRNISPDAWLSSIP